MYVDRIVEELALTHSNFQQKTSLYHETGSPLVEVTPLPAYFYNPDILHPMPEWESGPDQTRRGIYAFSGIHYMPMSQHDASKHGVEDLSSVASPVAHRHNPTPTISVYVQSCYYRLSLEPFEYVAVQTTWHAQFHSGWLWFFRRIIDNEAQQSYWVECHPDQDDDLATILRSQVMHSALKGES